MDHRKSLAMVAVRIGSQLMLHLMRLKIGYPAHLQDAVFRHGGIPHQVASRLNVVNVCKQPSHVDHRVSHDGERHVVRYIVLIGIAEIGFHSVAEGIKGA